MSSRRIEVYRPSRLIAGLRLPVVPDQAGSRETQRQPPQRERSAAVRTVTPAGQTLDRSVASVIALQRAAGNRATARALARWAAHPDKDKKGQFMTDGMAEEWSRFNPPLSK